MGKTYEIQGYADLNNDGKQDASEPAATVKGLKPLSHLGSGPEYDPVLLTLPGTGVAPEPPKKNSNTVAKDAATLGSGLGLGGAVTEKDIQRGLDKARKIAPDLQVPKSLPVPPPPQR